MSRTDNGLGTLAAKFAEGRSTLGIAILAFAAIAAVGNQGLLAQDAPPGPPIASDDLLEQEQAAFSAAAQAVAPSVVQIETFGGQERVGQELVADGPTTGTIVGKDGWIISTLYSFRQQPASILVSLADGSRAPARIVARDHSRELALLKIETKMELAVPSACPRDEVEVGQWSIALGRTFERESVSQSVGIISALDRAYGKAVQTDAKVSPVNYGGPLVDLRGRVIGILAPISPGAILEGDSSQLYDSGVGFAVPLVDILQRLKEMQAGKDVHTGRLGIVVADQNELAGPVKVAGAAPGSPAAKSGLKPGDVIISAAGRPVELLAHLRHALGPVDAGSPFSFTVLRKDSKVELQCTLVEQVPIYRTRYVGIETVNCVGGGVRITNILAKSPAANSSLQVGMRIVGCGEVKIQSSTELRQQVSLAELDVPLVFKVTQKEGGSDKPVEVLVGTWPAKLESGATATSAKTPAEGAAAAESKIEELELTLGDFPNKAWAWCPVPTTTTNAAAATAAKDENAEQGTDKSTDKSTDSDTKIDTKGDAKSAEDVRSGKENGDAAIDPATAREEFGLLVLLPEPGDVDRNKLREIWAPLLDRGWCVAVIQASNKTRWSAEEIELIERVRAQIGEKRVLDPARTVVGGLGVGGRLALVGVRASKGKASGVLLLGTPLENVRVQRENSPSESLHVLAMGPRDIYVDFIEQLQKFGYPAFGIAIPELSPSKWDTLPREQIMDWLTTLGRI